MFDLFTDRSREALREARATSHQQFCPYIAPEHILAGLVATKYTVAYDCLTELGVTKATLQPLLTQGEQPNTTDILPFTLLGKKLLEAAHEQSQQLRHNYIGTEHLLLGLLSLDDNKIQDLLQKASLKASDVRQAVLERIGAV